MKLYGEPSKAAAAGEMSFEEFAAFFAKPPSSRGADADAAPTNALGWASRDKSGVLAPYAFDRRPVGASDVRIQITHAGICHSDIHQAKDEWGGSIFPMVPG